MQSLTIMSVCVRKGYIPPFPGSDLGPSTEKEMSTPILDISGELDMVLSVH